MNAPERLPPSSRAALVTGAAGGIGACVVARLAERGWRVAGLDLRPSQAALSLEADVTDAAAVHRAAERVQRELGRIELLVTCAGTYEMLPVADITPERWQAMLRLHLGGAANACRAVLPEMLRAGDGAILMISSELAIAGGDGDAHYAAAKGAVIGFTRSLGIELGARGVRVNGVAPGPTDTSLLVPDSPWRAPEYLATLPLGRMVLPEEVADTVVFLAEEGTYFAAQTLSPNAGAVI